ncbi:MAG: class IV adenylate cyclase [Phycisphaerae bacterium]
MWHRFLTGEIDATMALEIEVKLPVPDLDAVRATLSELGARDLGAVTESNHILDSADGSLRRQGSALRVRVNRPMDGGATQALLTFKGPLLPSQAKRREEIEVAVGDSRHTLSLLLALGYLPILIYAKRRHSCALDDCRVELDEVPFIGRFVEIEGPDESAIAGVQRRLGLEQVPHCPATYVKSLLDHCARAGVDPLKIDFPEP